jgi:hypothetical protein
MTRASWGASVPPALLVVVACVQLVLVQHADLSPWAAGGFGMFASTDSGPARHLHLFVLRSGLEREIRPPVRLHNLTRRVRVLPREAWMRELARELAALDTGDPGPATGVRIELWRTRFERETLRPQSELLRNLEVSLEGD